jgi:SET domain-containing protein
MKSTEFLTEIYDENDDNYTIVDIDHKRRPRITLRHLQKLRKTCSIEDLEQKQRIDDVAYIYGRPDEEL